MRNYDLQTDARDDLRVARRISIAKEANATLIPYRYYWCLFSDHSAKILANLRSGKKWLRFDVINTNGRTVSVEALCAHNSGTSDSK